MLNIIWPLFIIISFIYGICTGRVNEINTSIFDSTESAVNLSITFLGTICLWNGVMEIASKTSLIEKLTRILRRPMKFLFPDISEKESVHKEISMNMIANILGLGNAATPLGLKAMNSLQEKNTKKDTLSNSMIMFIVINTASLQLIPTTVIALRTSINSKEPSEVIIPIWITSIVALTTVIIITKMLIKLGK